MISYIPPLLNAVIKRDVDQIRLMIASGSDVNATDLAGNTPLHAAARISAELVRSLLDAGAYADQPDSEGRTALHLAVECDNAEVVQLLIKRRADIDARSNDGQTPLFAAAEKPDPSLLRILLEAGADPTKREFAEGWTPIVRAAVTGNQLALQSMKIHLNDKSADGNTALIGSIISCVGPHEPKVVDVATGLKTAKLLIDNGASVETPNNQGLMPLHYAVLAQSVEFTRLLLENHANASAQVSATGETPLHYAVAAGNDSIIELLLAHHADKTKENKLGQSPLFYAISNDQPEAVRLLLRHGVDADKPDRSDHTPLYLAVSSKKTAVA